MKMDKKIFLLDKSLSERFVNSLTEDDLERIASCEEYMENADIIKIDANSYNSVSEALEIEGFSCPEDYYIIHFGFESINCKSKK